MPGPSDHQVALYVFLAMFAAVIGLGLWAARFRQPPSMYDLEEWGLGGRSFGPVLTWFLVGGEVYTAYTFLAMPALVYGVGAYGFWPVLGLALACPLAYVVLARMWSVTHTHGLVTIADFVRARFGSRLLALLVTFAGLYLMVQYMALQLVAVQAVLRTVGLNASWALWLAFGILAVFTFRSGLRAPALISVLKDTLFFWVVLAALLLVAINGGWPQVFQVVARRYADHTAAGALLLPPATLTAYLSTAVGAALMLFFSPHAVTGVLAAKNRRTVRAAVAAMPVFTLLVGVVGLLGFVALADGVVPAGADSPGAPVDPFTILPRLFQQIFPGWVAGTAFAAIAVGAMVPAAVMSIAAANLFTRNIYVEFFRPRASPAEQTRVSQVCSLAVKFLALASVMLLGLQFSLDTGALVMLQAVPAVGIGLFSSWPHRHALTAGFAAGLTAVAVLLYQIPSYDPTGAVIKAHLGGTVWPLSHLGVRGGGGVYVGFASLVVNLAVVLVGTVLLRLARVDDGEDLTRRRSYHADEGDPELRRLDEILDGVPVHHQTVREPETHRDAARPAGRYPYVPGRGSRVER